MDSACQQTLTDIETICVNDCSTDNSLQIVELYASEDHRVRLISHSINMGEGNARNTGLRNARGQYVFHLDADDVLPSDALRLLYSLAYKHNSDMVKGSFAFVHEGDDTEPSAAHNPPPKTINTNIYESSFLQRIPVGHCSYLYKHDFLREFKIHYPTTLTVGLDLVMLTTALIHAGKVSHIPDIVYHYRQTQESATRGVLSQQVVLDGIRTKDTIYQLLKSVQLVEAAENILRQWTFQIPAFWVNMATNQAPNACIMAFSKFRALVSPRVIPWQDNVPHHFRYLMALVLAEKDLEAINFLCSKNITQGFSSPNKLRIALEFVLTQVPSDKGALSTLKSISKSPLDLE